MANNKNLKLVPCLACGNDVTVDAGVSTAICGSCMVKIAGPSAIPQTSSARVRVPKLTKKGVPRKRRGEGQPYKPTGFPRGWHFKIYYKHTDGTEWSRGKPIKGKAVDKAKALQKARDKAKV